MPQGANIRQALLPPRLDRVARQLRQAARLRTRVWPQEHATAVTLAGVGAPEGMQVNAAHDRARVHQRARAKAQQHGERGHQGARDALVVKHVRPEPALPLQPSDPTVALEIQ